jgi:cytochrome c553
MKSICILVTAALLLAIPIFLWSAEDGPALFEANCAMCHGSKGEGNPDADIPKLSGTAMSIEELAAFVTKANKDKTIHADPVNGINEDQAKAIAAHVKSLKD